MSNYLRAILLWTAVIVGLLKPASISGQEQQHKSQRQQDDGDLLQSVQCRLDTSRTLNIQYSEFMDTYVEIDPFFSSLTEVVFDDDDHYAQQQHPVIEARVCWCSQYYNRRFAFCPAQFDSCKVEGTEGPITCFTDYQGNTFVRGFWFICVFWFAALAYAFSCSESGGSARAYLMRKLCLRCTSCSTEEELVHTQVHHMISRDPERAMWLLRSAFMRQRRSRQRRHRHRRTTRLARRAGRPAGEEEDTADTNLDMSHSPSNHAAWQQTMELKVKRFVGGAVDAVESDDTDADDESNIKEKEDETVPVPVLSLTNAASQMISVALSGANHNNSNSNNTMESGGDDNDVFRCAICLSTIQRGDRIGDIPCGHIFCVDCLKDWIRRKNHCPLCQRDGLATPRNNDSEDHSTDNESSEHDPSSLSASEEGQAPPIATPSREPSTGSSSSGGGGGVDGVDPRHSNPPTPSERGLRISMPDHHVQSGRFRFY